MKDKFDIQGMTCSSCSSHVEKAVSKVNGVKSVNVNLLMNNMIVEYDENTTSSNIIIKSVQDAGYGATLVNDEPKAKSTNKNSKKEKFIDNSELISSMKKRLMISIIFWIPLMYVAMYHMFHEWFGLPVPNFIRQLFDGPENRS